MRKKIYLKFLRAISAHPRLSGIFGALFLFFAYFATLIILNSPSHAFEQFSSLWPWLFALSAGFGVQAWLFASFAKFSLAAPQGAMLASGGVSAGAMAACCAHHLADVLPLLGLGAAALFLSRYQEFFLLLGVLSNATGIAFMLYNMKKHRMHSKGALGNFLSLNWAKGFPAALASSAAILFAYALYLFL